MSPSLKYKLKETHLAIVLLDLIGSTRFVQKVGPIKAARWLQFHDRLTRSLCYKFNGREIDRSDGFLMSFETTIDAVNFALKYQETVPEKTKLGCRVGIHWGKVVEVHQHELVVGTGVKQVELEGISKNIAARTMSLSNAGQVLLTKEAINNIRGRTNVQTPRGTRFACMGLYKFKGVTPAREVYAVGTTIESLQPPKGTEKAERLGGPKRIKKLARDRVLLDWVKWIFWRVGIAAMCFWVYLLIPIIINPAARGMLGLPYYMPNFDWFVGVIIQLLKTAGL